MPIYKNTRIVNGKNVIDLISVGSPLLCGFRKDGNIMVCELAMTKGEESILALIITDLVKRGAFDLKKFESEIVARLTGNPVVDNIDIPCDHSTVVKVVNDTVCTNCGLHVT